METSCCEKCSETIQIKTASGYRKSKVCKDQACQCHVTLVEFIEKRESNKKDG
jgi:hypothetical protein